MNTEQTMKRDRVIEAAIAAGKFTPERAAFWREEWEKDPARAEYWIERSAAGVVDPPKPTTDDLVKFFSGQRVVIGEPDPPEARLVVRELFGLRGLA